MATTCSSCGCNNLTCGCKNSYLTTPPPCPTPADCPDQQPCSEVFDAQCINYSAANILCGEDLVVEQNTSVQDALQNIVDYFCNKQDPNLFILEDLICREDPQTAVTIAPAGTLVNEALDLVTAYFCERFFFPSNITCNGDTVVTAGENIQAGVEELAGYFCNELGTKPKKFVKEFTNIVFDNQFITVLRSEMVACGLLSQSCGVSGTELTDFTYGIYFLGSLGSWVSITNLDGVTLSTNDTTGDITIQLNIAPVDPPVRLRVVIIG